LCVYLCVCVCVYGVRYVWRSFGKCLHNKELPQDEPIFASPKLPLFARYKFALALENSLAVDYVTEKFYQPLIAGEGLGALSVCG
jgi:hypothetical protein